MPCWKAYGKRPAIARLRRWRRFKHKKHMQFRIRATPIAAKDLVPGDLFSTYGPSYWDSPPSGSIGERVYIRTETPAANADDADSTVFRIEIVRDLD
jgi:hypothetical protein